MVMKGIVLSIVFALISGGSFGQNKSVEASSSTTDKISGKELKIETESVSDTKPKAAPANGISKRRENAPVNTIQRTPEMLERKKKAPLLNEPQQ